MQKEYEKYCHNCGAVIDKAAEICPKCGVRQARLSNNHPETVRLDVSSKWLITLLLCAFLGYFGAHRFYNEKYGTAILQLITFGGFGIWYIIDLIIIIVGHFKDKNGEYITMN
jgi:TM2 domain-containing membrane protein YozV/ribosomal protein L40E